MTQREDRESAPQTATSSDSPALPGEPERMPYEYFFPERRAIAEARQRVEHRMDQLVTGGAAGALVFSIPFLDRFAGKSPVRTWLLSAAWATLLVCLLLSLVSTFLSRRAFDAFLAEFDWAPPPPPMPQRRDG